jgi:hypothetical protein
MIPSLASMRSLRSLTQPALMIFQFLLATALGQDYSTRTVSVASMRSLRSLAQPALEFNGE